MPRLHGLTDEGVNRFRRFLDSQGGSEAEAFDAELLTNPRYARPAGHAPEVPDTCNFPTRFDAARTIAPIIEAAGLPDAAFDRGVWCWLSWLWFESLCSVRSDGRRDPKGSERWVLNLSYDRYYRHLLAGPWWIYQSHREDPERARALLCTPVDKPGELVGQIAASQELVSNPGLLSMVTSLYYDPATGKLRAGHGGKGRGGARRLVKVVKQLDMIWDLYSTSSDEFVGLLPKEFDRFRTRTESLT